MSVNPFSEPGDEERTVIRPAPGGKRAPARPAPPPPRPAPAADPLPPAEPSRTPAVAVSPLTVAASPLLQLLASLGSVRAAPEAEALRERAMRELHDFARRGRDGGIPIELLRPAHFALCASLDDVVLNTPWGAGSAWAAQPLVATFYRDARGGDFFERLRELCRDPAQYLPTIELMYLCLSLGFMGRWRNDTAALARVRAETHELIAANRKPPEPGLSRRWRGVAAPYRPARGRLPVWVTLAAAFAVAGGLFFWASTGLNAASDALQARALAAAPSHMPRITRGPIVQPLPPAPPPAQPTILDALRREFAREIANGSVAVLGTSATPIVRISDPSLFAPGRAVVHARAIPLLERIGAALKGTAGPITVLAYTDSRPIRTVRFPSKFQLSAARADAVRAIIAPSIGDPGRVAAQGRADADPIASNATAAGRERNRRIEIVLRRQD